MQPALKIKDYKDGKMITISSFGRAKVVHALYGLLFFIFTDYMALNIRSACASSTSAGIFCIVFLLASGLASYRFFAKALETEKLFINKERLDIILTRPLVYKRASYMLSEISDFYYDYGGKPPRAQIIENTVDYFGFQADKKVVEDLGTDGKASFLYADRRVRFGKELTSWEFNELEVLLYDLTGNDLRYTDEFERKNFPQN